MKAGWMTMSLAFAATFAFLFVVGSSGAGPATANATDTDGDGIGDYWDNCPTIANYGQTDSDSDQKGNACDADYTNDGIIGGPDFGVFLSTFGKNKTDAGYIDDVDCTGDDLIGGPEFGCFLTGFAAGTPGPGRTTCHDPSGATPPGTACPNLPL